MVTSVIFRREKQSFLYFFNPQLALGSVRTRVPSHDCKLQNLLFPTTPTKTLEKSQTFTIPNLSKTFFKVQNIF